MGMDPSENEISDFMVSKKQVRNYIKEKTSPLFWQKYKDSYLSFFIVCW
jgi:hypothetical protein